MAGLDIRVDTHELTLPSEALLARTRSLSRLMPSAADALVSAVSDVFDAEGPGWEPLAESTLRNRRGSIAKILQDTGISAGSTSAAHGSNFAEARGGTSYLVYHVNGTRYMPRRDPFDLGPFEDPTLDEIEDMFLDSVLAAA